MKTAEQLIQQAKSQINEIGVDEFFAVIKETQPILIDVREPDEFQAGAIAGAVNFPRGVLEMKICQHPIAAAYVEPIAALTFLKDQPIYLICGTSGRSALAAETLQRMGFTQVKSIQGGYEAWQQHGYPIQTH
ncbi:MULTISPECIES: rhodanese-like domain-containing protein [unclassified Acinetobacter]|uniref:rhodanese-like domain-containing protein n=1 Tax=unclassified Acinetobacter TaxID=196816 RepID=UPI002934210E|nr:MULTISPECIES: rhodanese-like domain-containing protein [unclassified Acinetobacter]WOE32880.1 rhodanese-like domain-containing protein [Acinetobacter sp. SAAs470]WOE38357.1 rhodanese-like domain-containing protein [Acinetobacter sp. SAAs474]